MLCICLFPWSTKLYDKTTEPIFRLARIVSKIFSVIGPRYSFFSNNKELPIKLLNEICLIVKIVLK